MEIRYFSRWFRWQCICFEYFIFISFCEKVLIVWFGKFTNLLEILKYFDHAYFIFYDWLVFLSIVKSKYFSWVARKHKEFMFGNFSTIKNIHVNKTLFWNILPFTKRKPLSFEIKSLKVVNLPKMKLKLDDYMFLT